MRLSENRISNGDQMNGTTDTVDDPSEAVSTPGDEDNAVESCDKGFGIS